MAEYDASTESGARPDRYRLRRPIRRPRAYVIGLVVLALVVATGAAVRTWDRHGPGARLLSRGALVTTSSAVNGEVGPRAVDGNPNTRWRTGSVDRQWLRVDLGSQARIARVLLDWDQAGYALSYQLQVSDDDRTWSTAYRGAGAAGTQTIALAATGRYLRLYATQPSSIDGYAVREVAVYGVPTLPTCATTDVARKGSAAASSAEGLSTPASAAIDGDPHTRWSSGWSDPQWLQIDLGRRTAICQVLVDWEKAYATAYDIQVSDDGNRWASVYSTTTGPGGSQVLDVAGTGRYVRLYLRARATPYGYSLWGLAIRAGTTSARTAGGAVPVDPPSGDTLLSYHKPVEASSSRDDSDCQRCDPAKAVDAQTGTQWSTVRQATGPAWLRVDLGAQAAVDRVSIQWGAQYARAYEIDVSNDAVSWTAVYRTTTGVGLKEDLAVRGAGRYVRLLATQAATADGYSLWEFSVYGAGGAPLPAPVAPDPPKDPVKLIWSDEFTGPAGSPPDPAKWHPDLGPGVTGELEYNTDNRNAYLDGKGELVMEARRAVTPDSTCPVDPMSGSTTCQYTSARLNTYGSFSFTYGRVEARIKVSGSQGLWPAFWLLGESLYTGQATWPSCGEIDVMEHVGRLPDEISSTLHAPAYHGADGIGGLYRAAGNLATGFHVYAADWRPDRITFSVDGHNFFTVLRTVTEQTRGPWVYDHPFVLLLDNAVGGPLPGAPDAGTVFPARMEVDYVRVYR